MKNLNEYINEGLFDNIGVGADAQIEDFFKKLPLTTRVENLTDLKKDNNSHLVYRINKKDSSVDIKLNQGDFNFPNQFQDVIIEMPSSLKINQLIFKRKADEFYINDLKSSNWNGFIPNKMINTESLRRFCIYNTDITDGIIEELLTYPNDLNYINIIKNNKLTTLNLNLVSNSHNVQYDLKIQECNSIKKINLDFEAKGKTTLTINLWDNPNLSINNCNFKINTPYIYFNIDNTKIEAEILNEIQKDKMNLINSKIIKKIQSFCDKSTQITISSAKFEKLNLDDKITLWPSQLY